MSASLKVLSVSVRPPGSAGNVGLASVATRGSGKCNPGVAKCIRPPGSGAGAGEPVFVGRLNVEGFETLLGYLQDEETDEFVNEDDGETIDMS